MTGPDPHPARRSAVGDVLAPLELDAWRGMLRVHARLTRSLDDELRTHHGITLSAYEVLMLLGSSPGGRARVSELSAGALLSVSGASRLVDRLARDGLAVREVCEEDGRGAVVALTASGRGRLRAARSRHLSGVRARFLDRLSDDDLGHLAATWDRLLAEGDPADGPP